MDWASLPPELIVKFYPCSVDDYDSEACLKHRLRGAAVCKSWQRALAGAPWEYLNLSQQEIFHSGSATSVPGSHSQHLLEWVIRSQPRVEHLKLWGRPLTQGWLSTLLASVGRKDLRTLDIFVDDLPEVLPYPAAFQHLSNLTIWGLELDCAGVDWLAQLDRMPRLRELELLGTQCGQEDLLLVPLPRLEHLTRLHLSLCGMHCGLDNGEVWFGAWLDDLPSLLELSLDTPREVWCKVAADDDADGEPWTHPPSPSRVTQLYLSIKCGAVDFSALPALRCLKMSDCPGLEGVPSLKAATALTRLVLGCDDEGEGTDERELRQPWALQALQAAAAAGSLRYLELHGDWTRAMAGVVGSLAGLRALWAEAASDGMPPLPPARAPVWRSLQAFRIDGVMRGKHRLPTCLRHATQMRGLLLKLCLKLSPAEIKLLAALPLESLWVDAEEEGPEWSEAVAALRAAASPRLRTLTGTWAQRDFGDEWLFWERELESIGLQG